MWDANTKLLLCNDRYVEMYGMSPDVVKPGLLLREVLEHRAARGNFKGDIAHYVDDVLKGIEGGKDNLKVINLPDGRTIAIAERMMPGGGWVATHDDVTEQHSIEQQRAAMRASEERRAKVEAAIAKFRERMEEVLRTVGENASAMKSTATALFASSNQTSERAEGAVTAPKRRKEPERGAHVVDDLPRVAQQLTIETLRHDADFGERGLHAPVNFDLAAAIAPRPKNFPGAGRACERGDDLLRASAEHVEPAAKFGDR